MHQWDLLQLCLHRYIGGCMYACLPASTCTWCATVLAALHQLLSLVSTAMQCSDLWPSFFFNVCFLVLLEIGVVSAVPQ